MSSDGIALWSADWNWPCLAGPVNYGPCTGMHAVSALQFADCDVY